VRLNFVFFTDSVSELYGNGCIKLHGNPSSGVELFHADRQTDGWIEMTKLKVALRNFAASKN
jgi:hypothetical protein